jgi:hypothetical protein
VKPLKRGRAGHGNSGFTERQEPLHPFKLARRIRSGRVKSSTLFYYEIAL